MVITLRKVKPTCVNICGHDSGGPRVVDMLQSNPNQKLNRVGILICNMQDHFSKQHIAS